MQDLVEKVYRKLKDNGIHVNDVRVNGGVATYIIGDSDVNPLGYNDVDLIFSVNLESEEHLLRLKDYVMECLLGYFPKATNCDKISPGALTDAYVSKLAKVWQTNGDKWTLVTLSNHFGMNLELKFVDTMKRKYQFSVDSFQIILDSLMQFYDFSSAKMSEDFYPTVMVESVFGDYNEAVHHLKHKLISTREPQEIRGGGLLKYCDLLARGYLPACNLSDVETLERLMCSRFFIDFSDSSSQYQKLDSYLINHFGRDLLLMSRYLHELHNVVNNSTVCLMGHERRQALDLITQMAFHIQCELDRQRLLQSDLCFIYNSNKYFQIYDNYAFQPNHNYVFHPLSAGHPMYHRGYPMQQVF